MIKQLLLFIHILAIFLCQLFFLGDITLNHNLPSLILPESEVLVSLTINKGEMEGFAKFQQDLPEGFTVDPVETAGATFSFKQQRIKLIWIELPQEEEFVVTYKLKASNNIPDRFSIGGSFSYILDGERKNVPLSEKNISSINESIVETDNTEVEEVEEVKESENVVVNNEQNTPVEGIIGCERTIDQIEPGKYKVTVTVKKEGLSGFGRITENIPDGFTASENDNRGGAFFFEKQQVKLIWVDLPREKEFKIIYRLEATGATNGNYSLNGTISYLKNEANEIYTIKNTGFKLNKEKEKEVIKEDIVAKEIVKEVVRKKEEKKRPVIPSPETGISYKVQIIALRKQSSVNYVARELNISQKVNLENHQGWNKYVVGSYGIYKSAKDGRNKVRKNVKRAFVTAYNEGKRITVQEALMISNQKWYK